MKLIDTQLRRLINSKSYDYGYRCLYSVERHVIDEIELSSFDKLPMHITEGWYLYCGHPELVSDEEYEVN